MSDYNSALPIKLRDATNNGVTSQTSGSQRALDVGINVAGVQVDPRSIRILTPTDEIKVRIEDGAGTAITSQTSGSQRALDVGINVAGVQVDPRSIRPLTASDVVAVNLRDASGSAFSAGNPLPSSVIVGGSAVSNSNPLPVYLSVATGGTAVDDYKQASSIAANATDDHDYVVSVGKTLDLDQVWASASGKIRVEVKIETSAGSGTFTSYYVGFNSTADPNVLIPFPDDRLVATGVKVRVSIKNLDEAAMDIYSTVSGVER